MENKKIKILLIEDNVDDTELIRRKLVKSANTRFQVTTARTLHDGLELVEKDMPDLIISDLGLPDSHGLDTVTKILLELPQIPLVVLSGFDDEAIAIKAVQSGSQDYLVKGRLENSQLERSIYYSIERAHLQAELEQTTQEILNIQANLHKILEKNADAIVVVSEDSRILFTNPAVESLLGRKQKELLNQPFDFPLDGGKTSEIEIKHQDNIIITAEMSVVEINWEGTPAYLASLRNITERKQMEEAIRNSEKNLRMYLEGAPDGVYISSLKGTFIYGNKKAEEITGYKREELIGKNFLKLNLLPSKYYLKVMRLLAANMANKPTGPDEFKLRKKNGDHIWVEINTTPIWQEGEVRVIGFVRNITKRKLSEKALRESEEKFSKAFLNSPEVIVISNIEDGTILEVNDTFLRLTGYAREEVIDKETVELGIWAMPEERADMVKTLKEKGTVSNLECRFRMKSGEIRIWLFFAEIIDIDNKPCILSVTTDITERKKMEETLRFSDTALRSLHEGVFALDNEFNITRWNEVCEQLYGIKASDAIGKQAHDVIHMVEEYEGQNQERINLLIEKGFNKEEQIHRTPRGDIWFDVHAQAIEANGKRYGWVTLVSDITERKKAEEALCFSDAAFKSIHESIIAMDTYYVITQWNNKSEEIYGIKASGALGKKLLDVIEIVEDHPGDNDRRLKKLEANGYLREEQLHRTKHGDVWVDTSIQAIESDGERTGWVVLTSVITQRKLAEEALKRSEEKYRELISTSSDGIISTDAKMRVIIWNRAAEKIFGYKEKEMLGQSILNIIPEKNKKTVVKEFTQLSKGGTSSTTNKVMELVGLKKDGSEVPLEVSVSTRKAGDTYIATIITRDISIRKEAEEKLRESEERYRDLFENASDLIQSCNAEGKFIYVNRAWRDALGYSEKEALNLNFWDIIHPDYLAHCKQTLQKIMSGETVKNIETAFVAKDGRLIQVEGNVNPVRQENKVVATRAIFRDITVRKEAEEKLRKIDQMKSEFLSNVSHELRTPLQSISGFTKLIMNGQVPDPATQQEFFQIIDRETMHLGNLINGLLDMSRLEAGRFQIYKKLIPIHDTIIDSIKMFHSLAREKNITLTENIPPQIPDMEVDDERMRQVVINLLSNAIKFSDPGGSVAVKVEKQASDLLFQVSDHGTGIREESMKHLFERFYRAEGETVRGGTGLGLYISKQIVEAHGGHIWAESKFGEGSTFSFTLPLNDKGGNNHGKEDSSHRRRPGNIEISRLHA